MKVKAYCSPISSYQRIYMVPDNNLTIGMHVGYPEAPCIRIDEKGKAVCCWSGDSLPAIDCGNAPAWFPVDGTIIDCELIEGKLL